MKLLLALLVMGFAVSANAQLKPQGPSAEILASTNWSKLGPTTEGPKGFTVFGKGIRTNTEGQYELWLKIVPVNSTNFVRRYDLPKATEYAVQFATVDCAKRLLSLERTSLYAANESLVPGRSGSLTPSSKKDAVRPGSIGETVFKYVCEESTSLPITNE